jgi:hypothetical protein
MCVLICGQQGEGLKVVRCEDCPQQQQKDDRAVSKGDTTASTKEGREHAKTPRP